MLTIGEETGKENLQGKGVVDIDASI